MPTDPTAILRAHGIEVPTLTAHFPAHVFPIWTYPISRKSAVEQWRRLRGLVSETGHWPLVYSGDDLETWRGEIGSDIEDELRQAAGIDPTVWPAWQVENRMRDIKPSSWPDDNDIPTYHELHFQPRYGCPDTFQMALLPTTRGWEAPAWVGFGGWNSCPNPAEHVALLKHWEAKYGAEVVSIDHDTIQMQVSRPPTTREDALTLAREHQLYCDGDTNSLEELAAPLLGGTTWFFWWD